MFNALIVCVLFIIQTFAGPLPQSPAQDHPPTSNTFNVAARTVSTRGPSSLFSPSSSQLSRFNLSQTLWSAIFTVVAFAWITIRPNVASPHDTHWMRVWRRLKLVVWAIGAPEMVLYWSVRQWIGARKLKEKFRDKAWTLADAHFFQMGGFVLAQPQRDGKYRFLTLTAPVLEEAYSLQQSVSNGSANQRARENLATILRDDSSESNSATAPHHTIPSSSPISANTSTSSDHDATSLISSLHMHLASMRHTYPSSSQPVLLVVVILQTLWFLVECLATIITKGLPQLLLIEVVVLAYLAMYSMTWLFWWDKPVGVDMPVKILVERKADTGKQMVEKSCNDVAGQMACTRDNEIRDDEEKGGIQIPAFDAPDAIMAGSNEALLCDEQDWEREDPDREAAYKDFKIALTQQFNRNYGTDENDLASWQLLCSTLGIYPVPNDLEEARMVSGLSSHVDDISDDPLPFANHWGESKTSLDPPSPIRHSDSGIALPSPAKVGTTSLDISTAWPNKSTDRNDDQDNIDTFQLHTWSPVVKPSTEYVQSTSTLRQLRRSRSYDLDNKTHASGLGLERVTPVPPPTIAITKGYNELKPPAPSSLEESNDGDIGLCDQVPKHETMTSPDSRIIEEVPRSDLYDSQIYLELPPRIQVSWVAPNDLDQYSNHAPRNDSSNTIVNPVADDGADCHRNRNHNHNHSSSRPAQQPNPNPVPIPEPMDDNEREPFIFPGLWNHVIHGLFSKWLHLDHFGDSVARMAGYDDGENYLLSTDPQYSSFSRRTDADASSAWSGRSHLPTFYSFVTEQWYYEEDTYIKVLVGLLCIVFGMVHLLAWSFDGLPGGAAAAPSPYHHAQLMIWRVSALLVASVPPLAALAAAGLSGRETAAMNWERVVLYAIIEAMLWPLTVLYIPARVALLVLAAMQLAGRVGLGAADAVHTFEGVNTVWWTGFFPHFA